MARHKNTDWEIPDPAKTWEQVLAAVLMDIRDEVRELNIQLRCFRVRRMLETIERIDKRLSKKLTLKPKRRT